VASKIYQAPGDGEAAAVAAAAAAAATPFNCSILNRNRVLPKCEVCDKEFTSQAGAYTRSLLS
jgi:hypothetical protein